MDFKKTGSTLLIAFLGGALFHLLHIPLPWLIGPLVSVMIGNTILTNRLGYSGHLKNGGLFFLSYVLGTSFTIETVYQVTHHLPLMLMITILTVVFSIFIAILVGYWSHLNVKDTILGSIPGGLSNMVALSEEIEGTGDYNCYNFSACKIAVCHYTCADHSCCCCRGYAQFDLGITSERESTINQSSRRFTYIYDHCPCHYVFSF